MKFVIALVISIPVFLIASVCENRYGKDNTIDWRICKWIGKQLWDDN